MTPDFTPASLGSGVSLSYLIVCGEAAQRWLEQLEGEPSQGLSRRIYRALVLFRYHDTEKARSLLAEVAHDLDRAPLMPPSVHHLLLRRLHAALAYQHYLDGDLDGARSALDDAQRELCISLRAHSFLLPLVSQCLDFRIQRARIARRENRWNEVRRQLDVIRQIHLDGHPFCEISPNRPIYLRDLRSFYQALPLEPESPMLTDAGYILDNQFPHQENIDRLEDLIFALPDFVISA